MREGADLLLNTHAGLMPGGVRLDRLTVMNTYEVVTHETHDLRAGVVIVVEGENKDASRHVMERAW